MIFREDQSGILYQIQIPQDEEDIFLQLQSKGKLKYIKVDPKDLPQTNLHIPLFYKKNKNGNIIFDLSRIKPKAIESVNRQAKGYILNILINKDWGDTYEECIAELQSSATFLETKLLHILKPVKTILTLSEIREKVALYLAGTYTQANLITELQNLGLTQAKINSYMTLFVQAADVAKLIYWTEQVWDYIAQIETQIKAATTINELENILNNIKFPGV